MDAFSSGRETSSLSAIARDLVLANVRAPARYAALFSKPNCNPTRDDHKHVQLCWTQDVSSWSACMFSSIQIMLNYVHSFPKESMYT